MIIRTLFLIISGLGFGLLSSAGVFTVLVAVGLIPRFAGKTHTAKKIFIYEEMVVFGALAGCIVSVFTKYCQIGASIQRVFPHGEQALYIVGVLTLAVIGLFCGMFIGCLALAIAEMLDSIPIFARRISFRHGIGLAVISLALGKVSGSILYFIYEIYHTVS